MMHKAWSSIKEVPYCIARSSVKFHGHTGGKNWRFESNLRLLGRSQLSNPSDLPCFFSCDQACSSEWFSTSVHPSVCVSVTPSSLCSHHHIILKFSVVIVTDVISMQKVKVRGQMSSQVCRGRNKFCPNFECFRTVTPVWIHRWLWNDVLSLNWYRRGALFYLKVIRQISRSHGTKNHWFWPKLGISGL